MGKMKAWRKEAEKHNTESGYKHQGRNNKQMFQIPVQPSDLFLGMMKNAGFTTQTQGE